MPLNSLSQVIKFTIKKKQQKQQRLLSSSFFRREHNLNFQIYHKPTWTGMRKIGEPENYDAKNTP